MVFLLRCLDTEGASSAKTADLFEASSAGMAFLRRAMAAQEVLVMAPAPELPLGATSEQQQRRRAFRAKGPGKVPFAKFGSAEGWHLVPEECLAIARVLEALLLSEPKLRTLFDELGKPWDTPESDLWFIQSFAAFCRRASEAGGCLVEQPTADPI